MNAFERDGQIGGKRILSPKQLFTTYGILLVVMRQIITEDYQLDFKLLFILDNDNRVPESLKNHTQSYSL